MHTALLVRHNIVSHIKVEQCKNKKKRPKKKKKRTMHCFVFKVFLVKRVDLADILMKLQFSFTFLSKHKFSLRRRAHAAPHFP